VATGDTTHLVSSQYKTRYKWQGALNRLRGGAASRSTTPTLPKRARFFVNAKAPNLNPSEGRKDEIYKPTSSETGKNLAVGKAVASDTEELQMGTFCAVVSASAVHHHVALQLLQSALKRLHLAYPIIPASHSLPCQSVQSNLAQRFAAGLTSTQKAAMHCCVMQRHKWKKKQRASLCSILHRLINAVDYETGAIPAWQGTHSSMSRSGRSTPCTALYSA
jgi:hypothetical protein